MAINANNAISTTITDIASKILFPGSGLTWKTGLTLERKNVRRTIV